MVVPGYGRSSDGRVFRLTRTSELMGQDRIRFVLTAEPIGADRGGQRVEVSRELDGWLLRDKIANGQAIPTPEVTYEELWQQLRLDLDARDG